tara:strand:+ start:292 stop:696 length:405 start_codon:yes stop_codon:yes gene_type:complete
MLYAKIVDNTVVQYPYSFRDLKKDNPLTSFPRSIMDNVSERGVHGIVEVSEVRKPKSETHNISEGSIALVSGTWTQVWDQAPKNDDELLDETLKRRRKEYGSPENQLEHITENGLESWQTFVAEVKARHPKPAL